MALGGEQPAIPQKELAGFGAGCSATSLSHRGPKGRAGCKGSLRALGFAVGAEESLSDLSWVQSTTRRRGAFVLLALSHLNFAGEISILHPVSFLSPFAEVMPLMIAPSQPFSFYSPVLQQEERPGAEGSEPAPSQPCAALAQTLPWIIQHSLGDIWGQRDLSEAPPLLFLVLTRE